MSSQLYKITSKCILSENDYNLENLSVSLEVEGGIRKRIKISGTIQITGKSFEECLGYKRLKEFEIDATLLKRKVENGVSVFRTFLNIKLNLLSGTWDVERKTCKINAYFHDVYETLEAAWETEVKVQTTDQTAILMSETSREDRYYFDDTPGLANDADGIAVICNGVYQETGYKYAFYGKSDNWDGGTQTRYFFLRHVIAMPKPGWEKDKDGCYYSLDILNSSFPVTVSQSYDYYTTLKDALYNLVWTLGLTVPVDWCQILDAKNMGKILMFPKSNLKRPDASNPAYYFTITLKEFIEMMKGFFNVEYFVENGKIKFIHPSERSFSGQFMITNYKGVNWSSSEYDEGDYIQKRTWTFEDSTNFSSYIATYGTVKSGEVSYDLIKFNNDILYLLGNPEAANDVGISLVAVDDNNKVIKSDSNGITIFNSNFHGSTIKSRFFNELEREIKIADFPIPIDNILELDPKVYYYTNVSTTSELKSATQQLNGSFANLKCVKK